jgi:hypothetical protein
MRLSPGPWQNNNEIAFVYGRRFDLAIPAGDLAIPAGRPSRPTGPRRRASSLRTRRRRFLCRRRRRFQRDRSCRSLFLRHLRSRMQVYRSISTDAISNQPRASPLISQRRPDGGQEQRSDTLPMSRRQEPPMNSFYEHHKDSIRFHYRCFDRILLNGLIQPFQQPEGVVGFFDTYRQLYPVGRDTLSCRTSPTTFSSGWRHGCNGATFRFWMRRKVAAMSRRALLQRRQARRGRRRAEGARAGAHHDRHWRQGN